MAIFGEMDLEHVNRVLVKHLDLDPDVKIQRDTRLCSLAGVSGEGFEPADLLDILHELGVSAVDYCSGERLRIKGVRMLAYAVYNENVQEDKLRLGEIFLYSVANGGEAEKSIITTSELAERITPGYLIRVREYDIEQKRKAIEEQKQREAIQIRPAA